MNNSTNYRAPTSRDICIVAALLLSRDSPRILRTSFNEIAAANSIYARSSSTGAPAHLSPLIPDEIFIGPVFRQREDAGRVGLFFFLALKR